jgi:hypothetical protein
LERCSAKIPYDGVLSGHRVKKPRNLSTRPSNLGILESERDSPDTGFSLFLKKVQNTRKKYQQDSSLADIKNL